MNLVLSIYVNDINNNGRNLNYELRAEIAYIRTAVYKNFKDEKDKYLLLDSLKTLWIRRLVRYPNEVYGMDIIKAKK